MEGGGRSRLRWIARTELACSCCEKTRFGESVSQRLCFGKVSAGGGGLFRLSWLSVVRKVRVDDGKVVMRQEALNELKRAKVELLYTTNSQVFQATTEVETQLKPAKIRHARRAKSPKWTQALRTLLSTRCGKRKRKKEKKKKSKAAELVSSASTPSRDFGRGFVNTEGKHNAKAEHWTATKG